MERRVLTERDERRPPGSGFHLVLSDRRQLPPVFALLVAALRYRG
jgi:hypothetical protein